MKGRRKYPDREGALWLAEGDYGKNGRGNWYGKAPGSHVAGLGNHKVTEHEDGTITVSPSIRVFDGERELWHGYLERGVWRSV